jgi:hypothetical protein
MSKRLTVGVALGLLCTAWLGFAAQSQAQERRGAKKKDCTPIVQIQNEARYTFHRSSSETTVFDTFTGRIYVSTKDTLREVDSVAGVVTLRKLEARDERNGSVIRQIPRRR